MFSTEDYTWTTLGWGWVLMGSFVATVLGLCGVVYFTYPDRPAVERTFPGGLEEELGGKGAVRVSSSGLPPYQTIANRCTGTKAGRRDRDREEEVGD